MKVALDSGGPTRLWHERLAEHLLAKGHALLPRPIAPRRDARIGVEMLMAFERRIYGVHSSLFHAVAPGVGHNRVMAGEPDVVIVPFFDGEPGERSLLKALLRGRAPRVCIRGFVDGAWAELAIGLPAIEERGTLSRSLDQVLVRVITLIVQAVTNLEARVTPGPVSAVAPPLGSLAPHGFLARGLADKVTRRLGPARGRPDHWRIATRRAVGSGVAALKAWPPESFTALRDDGLRFFADPFPFEHDGRTYLFFEDFPYRTRKGVIGLVEIDAAGVASPPRTVLEHAVHLSYPFVFAHRGAIYMMPEMSAAGRVQLFRADPFPCRWVADRVLLDGLVAGDPTLILHEDRYWIFTTLSGDGGSSWDQLGLFHAPELIGPWTAHPGNPVLIDAGAARPAGAMWHEHGVLMRVSQDCRAGYGVGLAICRVDRLDPEGYAQTIVARLEPPDGFGADGVHTLNRVGALEVIDLRSPHARR